MSEEINSPDATTTPETPALASQNPNAELGRLSLVRAESDKLLAAIKVNTEAASAATEQTQQALATLKQRQSAIESELATVQEGVAGLRQQLDEAKTAVAEINELLAAARTASQQTLDTNSPAAAALETIRTNANAATEALSRIEAIRTQAETTQGMIATKSEHIEGARLHADEVRSQLDTTLVAAQQSATSAEAQHQAGRSAVEGLNDLCAAAQVARSTADTNVDSILALRKQCEERDITRSCGWLGK